MSSLVRFLSAGAIGLKMLRSGRELPAMVVALAVGVGLTVAVSSLIHAVLFAPLPYSRPDRLAQIWTITNEDADRRLLSDADRSALTEAPSPFERIASYETTRQSLQRGSGRSAVELGGAVVSTDLFDLLGVAAARGRTFEADDRFVTNDRPIIVSARLIRSGVMSGALGELLRLDDGTYRLVGIMADDFWFPDRQTSYWLPLPATMLQGAEDGTPPTSATAVAVSRMAPAVGRLARGVTWAAARAQASARLSEPRRPPVGRVVVEPYAALLRAPLRPALLVLQAAAGLVLVLVCLNVGWLFAARARRLRSTFATMRALGAARGQVLATHLSSALCVAVVAIPGAILVAWTLLRFGLALESGIFSRTAEPGITWHVVTVATLVTLLASILACVPGAMAVGRIGAIDDVSLTPTRDRHVERSLMTVQVALVFAVSAQAVLVALVLLSLSRTNVGFRKTDFVVVSLGARSDTTLDLRGQLDRYKRLLERLDRRGVHAAAANTFPLTRSDFGSTFEPRRSRDHRRAFVRTRVVTPSYFRLTGLTVTKGRLLTEGDGGLHAIVVTDAFVASVLRGREPIGTRTGNHGEWTIVGVVPATRQFAINEEVVPEAYILYEDFVATQPGAASALRWAHVLAETGPGAARALSVVREEIAQVLPDVEVQSEAAMSDLIDLSVGVNRLIGAGSVVFASVALLLAALGLFAMVSQSLERRRRELGVRMALGATAARLVFESSRPVVVVYGAGLCVGLGLLLFARSTIESVMVPPPGVDYPSTSLVAGTAAAILLAVLTVACLRPLKSAAAMDPAGLLRAE